MAFLWAWLGDFMKVKSKYGDIMEVKTTGASKETADADGHASGYSGVTKYIDIIREVEKENEIAPALICGIISRETRGGRAIRKPSPPIVPKQGWGDYGRGFGLMQVQSPNLSFRKQENHSTDLQAKTLAKLASQHWSQHGTASPWNASTPCSPCPDEFRLL
uniref:lysozyme G-like n=1 Tax=Oncorhynchus gorbuscha TaxID=8017 RepID=UPI001EAF749B|nr:lysozyme G-like [Oncorhynchus gorbuscha]